jgi:EAL domain-containing protein (putative c-di-GMP-specific phosphodiesterase class I)
LHASVRDVDLVARLSSDEFIVVHEGVTDAADVSRMARRLAAVVEEPITTTPDGISVGASIGIAFARNGEDEPDQVLAWADLALARAKRRSKRAIEIYDEGLQEQLLHQVETEKALAASLNADELFLLYQPIVDLQTMATCGVEALVRWNRRDKGVQPPDAFIPIAEGSDLIIDLDLWVADRALQQLREWNSVPSTRDLSVAINISGRHLLGGDLHGHLVEMLRATGTDPRHLIVEVTETVLVHDLDRAAAQLRDLRALGVRVAIDDFGTGFASIAHLAQLPVDIVKIDRSFVERLHNDRDRTLLAMMADVGHHLGLSITAEGVETPEQLATIAELGCDRVQGFLFAHPLPADDVRGWLLHDTPRSIRGPVR